VEVLLGDDFKRQIFINSGIVDQDVESAEYVLRLGKKTFDFCLSGNICLYCDLLTARASNFINHANDEVVAQASAPSLLDA
jgi:hypothetical protein